MVVLRMSRQGSKKRPFYRIVVAESRFARDGRFVERIGSYDPMLAKDDAKRVLIDLDRARHWLARGALPTERVQIFLARAGIGEAPQRREQSKQHLPKAKAQERAKAAAEAAAKASAAGESAAQ